MEHGLGDLGLKVQLKDSLSLNPCSNGTWSRSYNKTFNYFNSLMS